MSQPPMGHLDPHEVAAYIDHTTSEADLARIEGHLADCAECRAELASASSIVASLPSRRRIGTRHWVAAAAAAVILLVAWPRDARDPGLIHREAPVTATVAPRALFPVGVTSAPLVLRWSSVPKADDYRVRIYDRQGSVLFERETTDTTVTPPTTLVLQPGVAYYWKVEARTGFDRSAASELTEFTLRGRDRP